MSEAEPLPVRKVEIQVGIDWVLTEMKHLKNGDIFRMTEPEELIPFGTWVATSDADNNYPGPTGDPVWGINADKVEI